LVLRDVPPDAEVAALHGFVMDSRCSDTADEILSRSWTSSSFDVYSVNN
jgi:hypothetical protein